MKNIIIYYYNYKNETFCKANPYIDDYLLYTRCTDFTIAEYKKNLAPLGWSELNKKDFIEQKIEKEMNFNEFLKSDFIKMVERYC